MQNQASISTTPAPQNNWPDTVHMKSNRYLRLQYNQSHMRPPTLPVSAEGCAAHYLLRQPTNTLCTKHAWVPADTWSETFIKIHSCPCCCMSLRRVDQVTWMASCNVSPRPKSAMILTKKETHNTTRHAWLLYGLVLHLHLNCCHLLLSNLLCLLLLLLAGPCCQQCMLGPAACGTLQVLWLQPLLPVHVARADGRATVALQTTVLLKLILKLQMHSSSSSSISSAGTLIAQQTITDTCRCNQPT